LEDVLQITDVDIAFIEGDDPLPPILIPISDRAKDTFVRWGMVKEANGIIASFSPDDFLSLCPPDWEMVAADLDDGMYVFQEITLPSSPTVLH